MKQLFFKIKKVSDKLKQEHISEYAAECAYFTILSFIPFIIFFITLIQFTNVDKETIYFWIKQVVPKTMDNIILNVIEEAYTKSIGTISIAAIFALWSSSKGFYYLCKGLRSIYKAENQKTGILVRLEGILYTLAFMIAVILFLGVMVFGNKIHKIFLENFYALSIITGYILKVRWIILISVMIFLFLCIYQFIPKNKSSIIDQIYGAIFSSVAWYVTSWCFSLYINLSNSFSNTYGSLTSIILIMMWVYVCMYIILIGGEINIFISRKKLNYKQ